ncbi:hypothetical protein [Metabacillus iocasae]|uniref:Uncharacterized protein n=1 Tax=Priestia iocasae TaxID=2291674 RepID=A0ABS2QWX1_9BACI|nr:hypothetical protein [Metabacillus iocasae]MBM7703492.1 hypothetical protein [Metabacillus iocasae]
MNVKKGLVIIVTTLLLSVAGNIGATSYFHTKEIRVASEGCEKIGGTAQVEVGTLALSYSFSCKK